MSPELPKTRTWIISLRDGRVRQTSDAPSAAFTAHKWKEADLEMALALAPESIGLGGTIPAVRSGGARSGPSTWPDQLYCDAMNRVHVVEVKRVRAGLDAIAQVLSYGEMYRMGPRGEMEAARAFAAQRHSRQQCLAALRGWAGSKLDGPCRVLPALAVPTDCVFPVGLSPRHVVVAPSFAPEALAFAKAITERGCSLELHEVELRRGEDAVAVTLTPTWVAPWIERTWSAFEHVWSSAKVRKAMELVGWAEPVANQSFSLSLRQDPRVRMRIEIDDDGMWLSTTVPDNYGTAAEVAASKAALQGKAVPKPDSITGGRWYWWFLENDGSTEEEIDLAGRIADGLGRVFPAKGTGA